MATRNDAQGSDEIGVPPDADEYTTGASAIDFASIGGGPVRVIEIVDGTDATLVCLTQGGRDTPRTFTGLNTGAKLGPLQVKSILGTGGGTTDSVVVRAYK